MHINIDSSYSLRPYRLFTAPFALGLCATLSATRFLILIVFILCPFQLIKLLFHLSDTLINRGLLHAHEFEVGFMYVL